jgi:putative transposase
LKALFGGAVSKDTVSRVWRKVKADWDAWNARSLADEPVVRLILDGTVVDVRLDHKATAISLLVVLGVRMVRRCCSRSRPWAGRAATPGAASSTDLIDRGLCRPDLRDR